MNQYSESLLAIPHHPNIGWRWEDVHNISSELYGAFSSFPAEENYIRQIHDEKCTFLCFIIAMSDEDLFECFGILPPPGNSPSPYYR